MKLLNISWLNEIQKYLCYRLIASLQKGKSDKKHKHVKSKNVHKKNNEPT
jgi:hypothetical protein